MEPSVFEGVGGGEDVSVAVGICVTVLEGGMDKVGVRETVESSDRVRDNVDGLLMVMDSFWVVVRLVEGDIDVEKVGESSDRVGDNVEGLLTVMEIPCVRDPEKDFVKELGVVAVTVRELEGEAPAVRESEGVGLAVKDCVGTADTVAVGSVVMETVCTPTAKPEAEGSDNHTVGLV
eukprot:gene12-biopygen8813